MSRKRMPTLTFEEQEFLLDTVDEFKAVVESKKNDVRSISKKEKAWKEIESRFCSNSNFNKRDSSQLKKCWNNLKMKAKKSIAQEKRERKTTGGGIASTSDETSQKICAIIPDQMHPLSNDFDNDAEFHSNKEPQNTTVTTNDDLGSEIEGEYTSASKTTLQSGSFEGNRNSRQSISSSFASAKVDLVGMAKEEHEMKKVLIQTQIKAAEEEHAAKMSILRKQEYLLDLQIQNSQESHHFNTQNTTTLMYQDI